MQTERMIMNGAESQVNSNSIYIQYERICIEISGPHLYEGEYIHAVMTTCTVKPHAIFKHLLNISMFARA